MRRTPFIILFVVACIALVRDSARAADIPVVGSGALPRVMIIFDNSLSMVLKPDDQFGDLTWQFDDYDPDNNPGASTYQAVVSRGGSTLQSALANDSRAASYYKCVDPSAASAPTPCTVTTDPIPPRS